MSVDEDDTPDPSIAVSPDDQSSDRHQSDADNAAAVGNNASDRAQADANQVAVIAKLDELASESRGASASSDRLALAMVEYQERAKTATRRFRTTLIVFGLIVAAILTVGALVIARLGDDLANGAATRNQIVDCVQPTGKCFQRGQRQTGEVVGTVNQVSTLAAACAADPAVSALPIGPRIDAINVCIRDHYQK